MPLTYEARPYQLTTDTLFYADLVFRETSASSVEPLSGWEASIQVQNLTQESLPAFVTVEFFDQSSDSILFLGNFWLRAGHVKLIDLASVGSPSAGSGHGVAPGFAGAGIAEVTDVQQLCDTDGDGQVDQSPTMPSVVVVNTGAGPEGRSEAVTSVYEGIPVR